MNKLMKQCKDYSDMRKLFDNWFSICAKDPHCSSYGGGHVDIETGEHLSVHIEKHREMRDNE